MTTFGNEISGQVRGCWTELIDHVLVETRILPTKCKHRHGQFVALIVRVVHHVLFKGSVILEARVQRRRLRIRLDIPINPGVGEYGLVESKVLKEPTQIDLLFPRNQRLRESGTLWSNQCHLGDWLWSSRHPLRPGIGVSTITRDLTSTGNCRA